MSELTENEIWKSYFESAYLMRYYISLSDRLRNRLTWISIAIAFLSCGPVAAALIEGGLSWLWSLSGLLAGLLGVYVASSGITKRLAVAIGAAKSWTRANGEYSKMWDDFRAGRSVEIDHFRSVDEDLRQVDSAALDDLSIDHTLLEDSFKQSEKVLCAAA